MILLAAAALFAVVVGAITFLLKHQGNSAVLLIAGAAAAVGFYWLFRFDSRRQEQVAAEEAARYAIRFEELSADARSPQFEFEVTGSSQIFFGLGCVISGSLAVLWAVSSAPILGTLLAAVLISAGGLLLAGAIPQLGRPVISLTKAGFKTPLTPTLSWKLIDGIYLYEHTYDGRVISRALIFSVPNLPQEISRFAFVHRLMYRLRVNSGRRQFQVVLKETSEHPSVVYRLARLLWTENTGRRHDWNPRMSEAFNTANRQLSEFTDSLQNNLRDGAINLGDIDRNMKTIEQNSAVMLNEIRRQSRILNWGVWVVVAFSVLVVAAKIVNLLA